MTDQLILLTGAGGGIGRATALEMTGRGARVILVGRTVDALDQVAAVCNGQAVVRPADISDSVAVARLVAGVAAEFGRLYAVVHNAGFAPLLPITDITDALWRQTIDTNLSAAFYLARAAWPVFIRQGGGCLVNISSESARDPFIGFSAYGAAKAGLNTLTLALASEGAKHEIRAHAIAPGAVETAMLRSFIAEKEFGREKTLDPAEVARVIADCIDGPLRYTSGETIYLHRTVG